MPFFKKHGGLLFAALWLTAALVVASKRLIKLFPAPDAQLNSDAYHTYLPNARKLLQAPWDFLTTDPHSYYVAPLGYVWAAVWGAEHARIEFANCILFLLCIVLMWRCARQLGGLCAAAIATALLATSPMLEWIAQVLTEPLYLFGLMLCLHGGIGFALGQPRSRWLLAQFATGLCITLLARPLLQFFTLATLLLTGLLWAAGRWRTTTRPLCVALLAALLLPAAVVMKNGVYFSVWGVGTGAGTGLYYGLNPLRLGVEPVYGGFSYDADRTPSVVLARTESPLTRAADTINAQVALNIAANTSPIDNARFFAHKFKSWLLFSTQELHIAPRFRHNRTLQWLLIAAAGVLLLGRWLRAPSPALSWPGQAQTDTAKAALRTCAILLLLVFAMAVQLTPVLYNMRYNLYATEPLLLLLGSVSAALLLHIPPAPQHLRAALSLALCWWLQKSAMALARASAVPGAAHLHLPPAPSHTRSVLRWNLQWLLQKAALALLLALLPAALTGRAVRHERHAIDPYRPGPVQPVLLPQDFGSLYVEGSGESDENGESKASAVPLGAGRWQLLDNPARFIVPLNIAPQRREALASPRDALWRLRFAIDRQGASTRTCRQAQVQVQHARYIYGDIWYLPAPMLHLHPDGQPHTYAIHGNHHLRPAPESTLHLTFYCPPGTILTWLGADLLQSTLHEAARMLVEQGIPINPYYREEPVARGQ